jgi:hypothetical protein
VNLAFPQFKSAGQTANNMAVDVGFAYGRLMSTLSALQRGTKFANWKRDLEGMQSEWNYAGGDLKAPPFLADVHMNIILTVYDALVDKMAVQCLKLKGLGGEADVIRIRHDLMDPLLERDSCKDVAAGSVQNRDKFRFCPYDWFVAIPNPDAPLAERTLPFPILVNDDSSLRNTTGWVAQHQSHPDEYKYQDCKAMVKKQDLEFLATKHSRKECGEWSQGQNVPHPCKKCGVFDHMTHECGMTGACCRYCEKGNHLVVVCPLLNQVCKTCKTMVGHSSECHKDCYGLDMSDLRDRARLYGERGFLTRRLRDVTRAYQVTFLERGIKRMESLPRQEAMMKMAQL